MSYKTLKKWLIWERKQEKKMGCLLPRASNMAENQEVEDVPILLLPCAVCGRTFRPEVLSKHAAVCERQHTKKRKKFDSAKQRIQGTELAEFLGPPPLVSKPKPPSPKKVQSRWKEKHEALVKTIRDEQIKPLDHSQCPHCDRFFGPKAFDRHEAWCKEQHTKKQVQTEDVTKAKLRLHARTKYRAPSFKSQRTVTKEKYSSTRPPVSSTSSTLPSAAIEHHERLPRNSSSISAAEIGLNTSMTGLGNVGRKSPALTRQNSIPKPVRRTDDEPLKKDIPKRLEDNTSSLPTLTRNSRAGSLSSQGSDCRSGTSSNHSVGPCETGMGSAATATPLYETKPTIKSSYSTNRKGKRDETKTESKRWKRKNEGREENQGTNQSVVHDVALYDTGQHGEPSNKSSKKVWTRFKSNNSNSLLVSSKTKKGKGKMKKSKPISPVKSSSSHKTIILSEHENELNNLKELNRMCEDNVSYNQDSNEEFNEMSPCYEVPSDLQTKSDLNHVFCDAISTGENVSDGDDIVCKEFYNFPTDSSYIFKLSTTDLEKTNSTVNDKRLETEWNNSNAKKGPIKSKPLSWIISLSPSTSELSLENEVTDLNNRDQISNDNLSEVIKIDHINEVNDENALLSVENECSNITNTQVNDVKIDGFAKTNTDLVLSINNEGIENTVNVVVEEDVKEESLQSNLKLCSRNSDKAEDKKSSPVSGVLMDANGLTGARSATCCDVLSSIYSLCPDVNTTSSKNLQGFSFKFSELSENNRITESSVRKSKYVTDCECNKIIKVIKSQLKLLSECKCLVHNNSAPLTFGSCDENTFQYDDFIKFSKLGKSRNKHLPHQPFKKTDRNGLNLSSYSDSEVLQKERLSKQLCFTLEKKHFSRAEGTVDHSKKKLKCLPALKNECFKDVLNQTSGKSDSENGSMSSVQCVNKFPHNYITQSQNGFEASTREFGKGGTSKKVSNNFSMGERLRDVRRLLNRSVEAQSTDSFDCVEEDRSTLNGSLPEMSAQFEMEEIGHSMQYPSNQNNAVIFTSVQRLSNPREKLNRRIALREWQLGQSGCTPLISGTWQQVEDEVNRGWKTFSGGDVLSGLPQSTLIHLPPLGNSTPKRLNRRWSPSGGEQITGGGTGAQDDSALSKFCHECGGRYPVAGAKFCCLCGVRRLAI